VVKEKPARKNIFLSYAHRDGRLAMDFLDRLSSHLGAAKGVRFSVWRDHLILPGEHWRHEIRQALEQCHFGLLLTSPSFFASDFIREEELSHFVSSTPEQGASGKAVPVGLVPYDFDLLDTRGLVDRQVYRRDDGLFYSECAGNGRDRFVAQLFGLLMQLTRKYR